MTQMHASDAGTPDEVAGPDPTQMRAAMGRFASGVTIVTGMDGDEPLGFACQSFASVSLEPPLVLFCADHRGRSWPRLRKSGRFTVNVLSAAHTELCSRFGSSRGARFDGLEWTLSRWGTPALPGVLLQVHAEVHDVHVAGDHDVVIGRVLELETVSDDDETPMIFYRGGFGIERREEQPTPECLSNWGFGDRWG